MNLIHMKEATMFKVFLVFLVCQFIPLQALACDCVPKSSEDNMNTAHMVFTGSVLDVQPVSAEAHLLAKMTPTKILKGNVDQKNIVELYTNDPARSLACGVPFEKGKTYMIYAHRDGFGKLFTSFCSGTKELSSE